MRYERGTVHWVNLPLNKKSHIQGGNRPCVIISDSSEDDGCGVVTVCPMTTRLDNFATHVPVIVKNKLGQVLCEQIITIDKSSLGDYEGKLTYLEIADISDTIKKYLMI